MVFAAVPVWAIEQSLIDHNRTCDWCSAPTHGPCGLGVALAGSLEDGQLPIPLKDVLPGVLEDLLARQRARIQAHFAEYYEEAPDADKTV